MYTCPKCTTAVPSPLPPAYALRALLDSLMANLGVKSPDVEPKVKKAWISVFPQE